MSTEAARGRVVGFIAIGALVALVGIAYFSGRETPPPPPAGPETPGVALPGPAAGSPAVPAPPAAGQAPAASSSGGVVTAVLDDIALSPKARLLAERFRCVCGCNDLLSVCTCNKTPGSRDMKQYLQQLVDEGKGTTEIEKAMVARYGPDVLP